MVGTIGSCDAILCPKGFFARSGRQESIDEPCLHCESLLVTPFLGQTRCDEFSERNVLRNLFKETNGESWSVREGWDTDEPICSWYGVKCEGDSHDNGVIALNLASNNMEGKFVTESLLLPSLEEVNLSGNSGLHVSFEDLPEPAASVESLSLTNVSISSLAGISQVPNLKHLAVSGVSGKTILYSSPSPKSEPMLLHC